MNGVLRTLIFDGEINLDQKLKLKSDEYPYSVLEYDLANPRIRINPTDPTEYTGYIIVAERINLINSLIETSGYDLVLIAKEIRIGTTEPEIVINTTPRNIPDAEENQAGIDANTGGDVIFIVQHFFNRGANLERLIIITSGGKGQNGGVGKPGKTKIPQLYISEANYVSHEYGSVGASRGFNDEGNPKYDQFDLQYTPKDDRRGSFITQPKCPPSGRVQEEYSTPPATVYTVTGYAWYSAYMTQIKVNIPNSVYPGNGLQGGYGGLPGKVSFILPTSYYTEYNNISSNITSETGVDGLPGQGANRVLLEPEYFMLGNDRIRISNQEFVVKHTKEKLMRALPKYRSEESVCENSNNRFTHLIVSPSDMDKMHIKALVTTGTLWYSYHHRSHNLNDPFNITEHRPSAIKSFEFRFYSPWSPGAGHYEKVFPNLNPLPTPEPLKFILSKGNLGSSLPPPLIPDRSESLNLIVKNWYQTVYEFAPSYTQILSNKADLLYRRCEFINARPYYLDVLFFIEQSEFNDNLLLIEVENKLTSGSAGLDYFGFHPSTKIAISPTRNIGLLNQLSDALSFYDSSLRTAIINRNISESNINLLGQFKNLNIQTFNEIEFEIETILLEIQASNLRINAAKTEIQALSDTNSRLLQILLSWARFVDDEIEKVEREMEGQEEPAWLRSLSLLWNGIKIIASIIAIIYGGVQAIKKLIEGFEGAAEALNTAEEIGAAELVTADEINEWEGIPGAMEAWQQALDSEWENVINKLASSASSFRQAISSIREISEKVNEIEQSVREMNTWSEDNTHIDAKRFRDNVLLTQNLDISGSMTYLQIEAQIKYNYDLILSKQIGLESVFLDHQSLITRLVQLKLKRAQIILEINYLNEVVDTLAINDTTYQRLLDIGQKTMDRTLFVYQTLTHQLNYLQLDFEDHCGKYDKFVAPPNDDVGIVLNNIAELSQSINNWKSENNNIGILHIQLESFSQNQIPGVLHQTIPETILAFNQGDYIRPSRIYSIEPLSFTTFIGSIRDSLIAVSDSNSNITEKLEEIFVFSSNGSSSLTALEQIGIDEYGISLIEREFEFHPEIEAHLASFNYVEVVMAYALASIGITDAKLNEIINTSSINSIVKRTLERLYSIWNGFINEYEQLNVISIRNVVEKIKTSSSISELVTILDNTFTPLSVFVTPSSFNIYREEIIDEVNNSLDPDFQDNPVLGSIFDPSSEDDGTNVILAVCLLYGGVTSFQLQSIIDAYPPDEILPNRLRNFLSHWDVWQRSTLERVHRLLFNISHNELMSLPNMNNTREHRFLGSRIELIANNGDSSYLSTILTKIPPDQYFTSDGIIETSLPIIGQTVHSNQIDVPSGINWDDYEWNDLFARAILGNWELNLSNKGNRPPLPNVETIKIEFLYSFSS